MLSKKRLFRIHGWLGLNLGLLLFVICFSGTVAVFSHEIDWLLNPDIRVEPAGQRVSWGTVVEGVREAYPESRVCWINAPLGPRFAQETVVKTPAGQWRRVYTNPYTGRVQGDTSYFNVQRFFRSFHRRFFIYDPPYLPNGVYIVGFFGFVLLFSAVTGILFYKRWWQYLFRLRVTRSRRVFWSDLHRLIGVWTLLFGVLIALTGVWYFVEQGLSDLRPEGGEAEPALRASPPSPEAAALPFDRLLRAAREAYPELELGWVRVPEKREEPLLVMGQAETWIVRDRANAVALDPYSGDVLKVRRGGELSALARWIHTADPLHFGTFGGLVTKTIWFVLGLALSFSILAGGLIWHLRVREQSKPHRLGLDGWSAMGLTLALLIGSAYHTYRGILDLGPAEGGTVAPTVPWTITLFIAGFVVAILLIIVSGYGVVLSHLRSGARRTIARRPARSEAM